MRFKNGILRLYGDSREMLKELPSASVHVLVTSVPYYLLRDYQHKKQIGRESKPELYIENLMIVFKEVYRVLRDDGVIWVNIDDTYNKRNKSLFGVPGMFERAMKELGWLHRQTIIWGKNNGLPESVKDRCVKKHEYLFLFSKKGKYFFDVEAVKKDSGARLGSVWMINVKSSDHKFSASFPEDLVLNCLKLSTSRFGICTTCGKPVSYLIKKVKKKGYVKEVYTGKARKEYEKVLAQNPSDTKRRIIESMSYDKIPYPKPSCKCKASINGSHVVLDPFSGSDTVGKVSRSLGHKAVLIDLQ